MVWYKVAIGKGEEINSGTTMNKFAAVGKNEES